MPEHEPDKKTGMKTNSQRFLSGDWLFGLMIVVGLAITLPLIYLFIVFSSPALIASAEVNEFRQIELPPQSEILSFERQVIGQTRSWIFAELLFVTASSEQDVLEFFERDDFGFCEATGSGHFSLEHRGLSDDGRGKYILCYMSSPYGG